MKIKSAIFLGTAYPYRGGLASFNQKLASMFLSRGIAVRIFTFTVQYPSFLFPGKSQYTDSPPPEELEIERCVNSVNPFNWIRIGLRIRRERPDVVVVRYWIPFMSPCLGTICRIARTNRHTRIISLVDNVVPHERRIFDNILTRYFVGSADGFVYMSAQVKADLDRFTSKPSEFAPHPLYDIYGDKISRTEALKNLGLDPAYRYSLFFGFVRDYKGLDLLIGAWGEMKRSGTLGLRRLIVAGEYYSDKAKYLEMIAAEDLAEEIIIRDGFIPDDRVRDYFCSADLVIQPYKSATQSGVTQIAYSFDVPMIVTRVGGLAEIVPDSVVGYVVDTDPGSIARAIDRFYAENKAEEFIKNIQTEKKRFSWEAMTDCFEKLLNRF